MSLFGRKEDTQTPRRSDEERERARLEREERRRQRTGEMPAVQAPAPDPEPEERFEHEPEPAPIATAVDEPLGVRRVGGSPNMSAAGALGPRAIPPKPHKPARRRRRPFVRVIPVILVLGVAAFAYAVFQPFKGSGHGTVVVDIPTGASASQIGNILADKGVIDSSFFFGIRARLSGKRNELRSGHITLREDMSYGAAIDALTTVPPARKIINVTVPEGRSAREIVTLVKQAQLRGGYLKATRDTSLLNPRRYGAPKGTHTLEGFLWPATYELPPSAPARRLAAEQIAAFKRNIRRVNMRRARARNLSRYDVLIIASMIEREAMVPKDRRLIAAVIYNRLKQHMPLGIDATIRYRLNNWSTPLTNSDLRVAGPYNTRTHGGLPPTPIGNPGLASLQAAANPAHVPYLFYVVKPCGNGGHAFSSTDAQFQKDVAAYQKARQDRGGKDPSHC
jgi:uncharacterized YceG family protein